MHGHAGHDHPHHHHHAGRQLGFAFGLTLVVLGVELAGGLMANSLALLADAGHVLTDLAALGLAWFATRQAERPPDEVQTYGYHRTGILVALANATTLIVIAAFIAQAAWSRLWHPATVQGLPMLAAAAVGLVVNLGIGLGLRHEGETNLNVRSALLHVLGDAAASAGVIVAAGIVLWTGWRAADPVASVAIALLIAGGAWSIVREALNVLMEAVPRHIEMPALVGALKAIPGVRGIHDLHVWSLASSLNAMSCHVLIDDQHVSESATILAQMETVLADRFAIRHATIQPECAGCDTVDLYCGLAAPRRRPQGEQAPPD